MEMLKVIDGDIIENAKKYNVDAIVNPENRYMDFRKWCMWCYI